jgi:hypothetical protein
MSRQLFQHLSKAGGAAQANKALNKAALQHHDFILSVNFVCINPSLILIALLYSVYLDLSVA